MRLQERLEAWRENGIRRLTAEAHRRGAEIVPCAPREIYIDPSNACNLKCPFCPQSDWNSDRKRGLMKMDLYLKILDQVAAMRPLLVNLFSQGESILNKQLVPMIREAAARGLKTRIHTNAVTLDANLSREIIPSGLTRIHFSFDTADPVLYERMRPPAKFDKVLRNILGFLEIRKELRSPLPIVCMLEMVGWKPEFGNKPPPPSAEYTALFKDYDVEYDPRVLHNFAGQMTESVLKTRPLQEYSGCDEIYSRLVISFDGKVLSCCLDSLGHNIMGDLAAGEKLADIWNGPKFRALRRALAERRTKDYKPCDTCDVPWQGLAAIHPALSRWTGFKVRTLHRVARTLQSVMGRPENGQQAP